MIKIKTFCCEYGTLQTDLGMLSGRPGVQRVHTVWSYIEIVLEKQCVSDARVTEYFNKNTMKCHGFYICMVGTQLIFPALYNLIMCWYIRH